MATLTRKQKAEQTRTRILRAAYEQFSAHGFHATTMTNVARRAGVSEPMMYVAFGNKNRLAFAAFDLAVMGPDDPVSPAQARWHTRLPGERDARAALRTVVREITRISERVGPMFVALQAASSDPEAARFLESREQWRRKGYADIVRILAGHRGIKRGLSHRRATDILMLILSPASYVALSSSGWTRAACTRWFTEVLEHEFLENGIRR